MSDHGPTVENDVPPCPACGGNMRFCECMDDPFAPVPESAENGLVPCDHNGPCPQQRPGCRWVQFERVYTPCECGGWDERWISRAGDIRLDGRTHHARTCPIPPGHGEGVSDADPS